LSFTDPSWLDTHTATWDFGDGTPTAIGDVTEEHNPPEGKGSATGSHTYNGPYGTHTVTLTVSDNRGGVTTYQFIVNLQPVGGEILPTSATTYLLAMMAAISAVAVFSMARKRKHPPFF
jgi:PKD repeat protein